MDRDRTVRRWFDMWLENDCEGLEDVFSDDVVYIESWGPRYDGIRAVRHWFEEWNARARVLSWDITDIVHSGDATYVEWHFHDLMDTGREEEFDGVSKIL